jgi:hypothetical protein
MEQINTPIIALADKLGKTVNDLLAIKNSKLTKGQHYTGYGKNTYFTPEGVAEVELALEIPLAVPDKLNGVVLHPAKNPDWVMVKLEHKDGKIPVKIGRKYRGKLIGKRIVIDAITDASGSTTYRHAELRG